MGQGREIVGGKYSSFTPPSSKYSSINHTNIEHKQPSHENQKAVEQVIVKDLVDLEFGSRASLDLRKVIGDFNFIRNRPRASLGFEFIS